MLNQQYALSKKELLIDIAQAGDFGKYRNRNAARVSMGIARMIEEDAGYFDAHVFTLPYREMAAEFYRKFLEILPSMIENPEPYKGFWAEARLRYENNCKDIGSQQKLGEKVVARPQLRKKTLWC